MADGKAVQGFRLAGFVARVDVVAANEKGPAQVWVRVDFMGGTERLQLADASERPGVGEAFDRPVSVMRSAKGGYWVRERLG